MDWNRYAEFLQRCIELATDEGKEATTLDIGSDYRQVAAAMDAVSLGQHPVLRALASPGDQPKRAGASEAALRPLFFLDAAQDAAVRAAMAGNPITVIEGPPGCGKSQAVAALMYECWVRGKSALFVSSTNFAVNVVLERLRTMTDQKWLVLRHGKPGESDIKSGWDALEKMGVGSSSEPRLGYFPAPDNEEIKDLAEFERLRAQLEGYEPEAIDESLRTIAGTVARCIELQADDSRLEREHRLQCRFGDLEPMDPAEASRMHAACRKWIGSFVDLGLRVSAAQEQRRRLLQEAAGHRAEAMRIALNARAPGDALPESIQLSELHALLVSVESKLQNLRATMAHATISPLGASADKAVGALMEPELATRLKSLADLITHARQVTGSRAFEKRAHIAALAHEHRRLCEAIRCPTIPEECIDDRFQAALLVRWRSFREAAAWLDVCASDRTAVRLLPFSRWRKARRRVEVTRFDLLMHAASISPLHESGGRSGGVPGGDDALLEIIPIMLRAPELSKGSSAQRSLAHHSERLATEAQAARIAPPGTGWQLDDLPRLERFATTWYAEIRSRIARKRLSIAAAELRSLSSRLQSSGLRSMGLETAADLIDRLSRGELGDQAIPERFIDSDIRDADCMLSAVRSAESAEAAASAIATPMDMHATWLAERPDRPGDPAGAPALAADATASKSYHDSLDDWAGRIEEWDRRRDERRAVSASLEEIRQRARNAVDIIARGIAPEFARRMRNLTHSPNPADWDIDEIRKTLAGFTPAYIGRQRAAAQSRIVDRERRRIGEAMKCSIGAEERKALERLAKMPPRRRTNDESDADVNYVDCFRAGLRAAPLIVTTTNKTFDRIPMVDQLFDLLVVDEASRTPLIDALPGMIRARSVVVIGDPNQLPPIERGVAAMVAKAALECDLDLDEIPPSLRNPFASLYETAARACRDADFPPLGLTNHYRSHPAIIGFSNQAIYRHRLSLKRHPQPSQPCSPAGVFAVELPGRPERIDSKGLGRRSTRNEPQARWIVGQLESMTRAIPMGKYGIVTLHNAQKQLLEELVDKARSSGRVPPGVDCLVGTVDTFQGSERDHVFYNIASDMWNEGQAAWAEDLRRVNVAVTRARQSLIIVADLAAIRGTGKLLAQLVRHADICNDLRRTNRGAHELYAWMLIDEIPLLSDPECVPDEETVVFRVRNRQGLSSAIAVLPRADHAPPGVGEGMPVHCFVGKDIMRSPRGAAARLRRLLTMPDGEFQSVADA